MRIQGQVHGDPLRNSTGCLRSRIMIQESWGWLTWHGVLEKANVISFISMGKGSVGLKTEPSEGQVT